MSDRADWRAASPAAQADDNSDDDDLPATLTNARRWLLLDKEGIASAVTGYLIDDASDSYNWATWHDALTVMHATPGVWRGCGFVLGEHGEEAFVGLVLHNCLATDGALAPWAMHLLTVADSYTEQFGDTGLCCVMRFPLEELASLRASLGIANRAWTYTKRFEDGVAELQFGGVHRLGDARRPPFPNEVNAPSTELLAALLAPAAVRDLVIEVTVLAKHSGPLTKRIHLDANGMVVSDGSACIMSRGEARRVRLSDLAALGALIERLQPHEALALGALRDDLPDRADIVTKKQHEKLNGAGGPDLITRTHTNIIYRGGKPALLLIDFDTKGMSAAAKARIAEAGGVWNALVGIVPELASVGRVIRPSTSAGLYRSDTGEQLPGSQNQHIYLLVKDGVDTERFLRTLHDRCWLAGLGWMMVGAGGQLLERSIIDRMVYAAERLVFEGPPVLVPPVAQDATARVPTVIEGGLLDTIIACPPLRIVEQGRLSEVRAAEEHRVAPERARAVAAFIAEQTERIVQRTGVSHARARHTAERLSAGILLTHVVLPFDAEELAGCTVSDVLADPDRFEGATLADPLEGIAYGICKARIMRRTDGTLWIHSFAHGRTVYELRHDADTAAALLDGVPTDQLVTTFVRLALASDLAPAVYEALRNTVAKRAGIGRRTLEQTLRQAREQQQRQQETERRTRAAAARRDRRPRILRPSPDEPWLPQMLVVNGLELLVVVVPMGSVVAAVSRCIRGSDSSRRRVISSSMSRRG